MQSGRVSDGELLQVKGKTYKLEDLFAGAKEWRDFEKAYYVTIYLSPGDYHRIHSPVSGELSSSLRITGKLWSVGSWCTSFIPELYCIQERLVLNFGNKASLVCVGAFNVGSIEQVIANDDIVQAGVEVAKFKLGSTVVLLINQEIKLPAVGSKVLFGQSLLG